MGNTAMKEAMARKDYSFRNLAFLTKYSAAYLCRVAKGDRQPSREAALAIAKALGVPVSRIYEEHP